MRITRLGQGVDQNRRLDPAAIDRTVSVLRDYRHLMDRHQVGRVRMTATSAARDASNREDFFAAAAAAIGVRPELLGGAEEARLSFMGAMSELDPAAGPWLVADIGGGSTELAVGPAPGGEPQAVCSLEIGCVRITERFLVSDPPAPDQVAAARRHVGEVLAAATKQEAAFAAATKLVGLAGTVAALAAIDQGLTTYERDRVHHYRLDGDVVERLLTELAGESAQARRRRPGVESERADVIVGGVVVLAELMRYFSLDVCLTSEADILDGLVQSLLAPGQPAGR
jgi:exopolyphosphatase/guanosine-5'-triphosphate,3'-diphosphate pyrophosphatase